MNEVEILIISNTIDFTTDYVCVELSKLTDKYLRINRDLFRNYSISLNMDSSELFINVEDNQYKILPSILKSVYYRAPIYLHYIPRHSLDFDEQLYNSQWMAFLRNLVIYDNILWMNNPIATFAAENKLLQIKYAKECGFKCPETYILNNTDYIKIDDDKPYIVKSLDTVLLRVDNKEGFVYSNIVLGKEIKNSYIKSAPIILQEYIDPKIDIRVTVVKDKVFSVKILNNNKGVAGDWRLLKNDVSYVPINLPSDIENKCIEITKKLKLSFGGIDLALSHDNYYFIEINPTGEWGWLNDKTEQKIDKAIVNCLMYNHECN